MIHSRKTFPATEANRPNNVTVGGSHGLAGSPAGDSSLPVEFESAFGCGRSSGVDFDCSRLATGWAGICLLPAPVWTAGGSDGKYGGVAPEGASHGITLGIVWTVDV